MAGNETTYFDKKISGRQMQFIKAALPYINPKNQMAVSMLVKFTELRNTINYFHNHISLNDDLISTQSNKTDIVGLINAIKGQCNPEEANKIEMMMLVMELMKSNSENNTDSKSNDSDNNMTDIMSMLSNMF